MCKWGENLRDPGWGKASLCTGRGMAGAAGRSGRKGGLGPGRLAATERYLHTRPDADDTAPEALSKIRRGS